MFKFLIGISVYKQPLRWIQQSIDSVINQTYKDWGLIVRLDGPNALPDRRKLKLQRYLNQYTDKSIIVLNGSKRLGTFGSYKSLFAKFESEYIMQLDADDFLEQNALEIFAGSLAENQAASFAYSYSYLVDESGDKVGYDKRALEEWNSRRELVQFLTFHPRAVKRESYDAVGGYSEKYKFTGDYDLCLKLTEQSPPIKINEFLLNYRIHPKSESQSHRVKTHNEAVIASKNAIKRRGIYGTYSISHNAKREVVDLVPRYESPVIVAGMHKAGTSMISLLLSNYGVNMGNSTIPPDNDNPKGYNEDIEFLSLQRQWYIDFLKDDIEQNSWVVGGYSERVNIPGSGLFEWKSQASNIVNKRKEFALKNKQYWGWKDPRVSLILPFWKSICTKIRVVCCFRSPWDTLDSLLRRRLDNTFQMNPFLALNVWSIYYSAIHDYQQAAPESVIVVSSSKVKEDPSLLADLLNYRWGMSIKNMSNKEKDSRKYDFIEEKRLQNAFRDERYIRHLYRIAFPKITRTYEYFDSVLDALNGKEGKKNENQKKYLSIKNIFDGGNNEYDYMFVIVVQNPSPLLLSSISSILELAENTPDIGILIIDLNTTSPESINLLYAMQEYGAKVLSGFKVDTLSSAILFMEKYLLNVNCKPKSICVIDENIRLPINLFSQINNSLRSCGSSGAQNCFSLRLGEKNDFTLLGVPESIPIRNLGNNKYSEILLFSYEEFIEWKISLGECINQEDDVINEFNKFLQTQALLVDFTVSHNI